MEIENNFTGCLNDAAFSYPAQEIINEYKNSFGNAEVLIVNLNEIMADFASKSKVEGIEIADDGKCITITIEKFKSKDSKGKFSVLPNPGDVMEALKRKLDRAVEIYAVKFPVNNIENLTEKDIENIEKNIDNESEENLDDNKG